MKNCLHCVLFVFLGFTASWASPFEDLVAAPTDFKITFDNSTAKVLSQGITQRAVIDSVKNADGVAETITYQAYHLEFAFQQKFSNSRQYTSIEFYNGNTIIHILPLSDPSRKISTTRNRLNESNYLAINLEGVPLIMLNDVTRINFER